MTSHHYPLLTFVLLVALAFSIISINYESIGQGYKVAGVGGGSSTTTSTQKSIPVRTASAPLISVQPFSAGAIGNGVKDSTAPDSQTGYAYAFGVLSSTTDGQTQYHVQDYLGTTRLTTSFSGVRSSSLDVLPFGGTLRDGAAMTGGSRYGYTGKEQDVSSGLHYFGARYMDSLSGRFTSVDPVARIAVDPYDATDNNPLVLVDHDGKASEYYAIGFRPGTVAHTNDIPMSLLIGSGRRIGIADSADAVRVMAYQGHKFTGKDYLFDDQHDVMKLEDLAPSKSAQVCLFSACRTVNDPQMEQARSVEVLSYVLAADPNVKLVLGYESAAPITDNEAWKDVSKHILAYLQTGVADKVVGAWIDNGRKRNHGKDYDIVSDISNHQKGRVGTAAFFMEEDPETGVKNWYYSSSTVDKKLVGTDDWVRDQKPNWFKKLWRRITE
ncbi:MAG: RHS repeat-associated core domain-containing protein [Nanoarchaeota archaeon]